MSTRLFRRELTVRLGALAWVVGVTGCLIAPTPGDANIDGGSEAAVPDGATSGDASDAAAMPDQGGDGSRGDGGIDYRDNTRWADRVAGDCPAGFQKVLDPFTSRCLTTRECIDPGTNGVCRAYCANRNVYGTQPRGAAEFECISSVSNEQLDSPRWPNSCDNQNNDALNNPTLLPIDCRCQGQLGRMIAGDDRFTPCLPPSILGTRSRVATGPGMPDLRGNKGFSGGFVQPGTRRLIIGGYYSDAPLTDEGLIFAVDLDTGNREVLSGAYNDPVNGVRRVGCGASATECASPMRIADDLGPVNDVKLGADGNVYAYVAGPNFGSQIWRVDLATGRRTLVWREVIDRALTVQRPSSTVNTDQCWNGVPDAALMGVRVVQTHPNGWAMDREGNHYLAALPNGAPVGPNGIIRISADGRTCSWVTRYFNDPASTSGPMNAHRGMDIGTGGTTLVRFDWRALLVHTDGFLYARNASALVKIDLANGNRTVVANADLMAGVGRGGAMGDRWLVWDETRNRMWSTGGGNSTTLSAVNLETGDRDDLTNTNEMTDWYEPVRGPLSQNFQLRGGLIFDPRGERDVIIVHNNTSIVRLEVRTGNSLTLSY